MRPFNRDVDGVGTRVGVNPWSIADNDAVWDEILMGTVLRLDDDKKSPVDYDKGQPLEGRHYTPEDSYVVFDNDEEASKVKPFKFGRDQVGTRVAVSGEYLPQYNDHKKFYFGKIIKILGKPEGVIIVAIEFDENVFGGDSRAQGGTRGEGYGHSVLAKEVFVFSEDFVKDQASGMTEVVKSLLPELLILNLSNTNSNRVNLVIEDLKSKIGEDWEAQVRQSIEPQEAAEIFIALIKDLEKQEQERLDFGKVLSKEPIPIEKVKRKGRPKKEKLEEPNTTLIEKEITDDEIGDILDSLII